MAGNKALEKFKNSKVPKKGTGTTNAEVPVYQEPNTHSKIIGTIKKNELINWISKSICDEKEWVRCDNKNNFGYIISNDMDGNCNLNLNSIQEKIEEKKEDNDLNDESQISNEEYEIVNEALKEILEEDDKKDENSEKDNNSNSTGLANEPLNKSQEEFNKVFVLNNDEVYKEEENVFIPKNDDIFKEDNLDNLYFDGDISNLDGAIKENNKILGDILSMIEKDKDNEKNVTKALESISEILPEQMKLASKDLLLSTLDSIPGGKYKNNLIYKENKEDNSNFVSNINMIADNIAEGMKEVDGTIRLTDGSYNGNNFSPKYYENGWNGGSKAGIKTFKVARIGEKVSKVTGPIGNVLTAKDFIDAVKEDGYKIGDNTILKASEEVGGWAGAWAGTKAGAKIGLKIGSMIPAHPVVTKFLGVVFGGVIGTIVGAFVGEIGGELIVDKKNEKEEDEKEDVKKNEKED